jgi:hypothetical protein
MPTDAILTGADVRGALTAGGIGVLDYWESLREGRPIPCRSAFDPSAIRHQLPGIQLVEARVDSTDDPAAVADEVVDFVYRLVGTRESAIRGQDPTGKSIAEGAFGNPGDRVRQNYLRVFREAVPLVDLEAIALPAGYPVQDVSLFLPFAVEAAPERVAQILVYSEQSPVADQ